MCSMQKVVLTRFVCNYFLLQYISVKYWVKHVSENGVKSIPCHFFIAWEGGQNGLPKERFHLLQSHEKSMLPVDICYFPYDGLIETYIKQPK